MSRTKLQQWIRKMRFDEAYMGWQEKRLTQEQAAEILGVTDRSFRRYAVRYEAEGLVGLVDRRIETVSARGASADEVMRLVETYAGITPHCLIGLQQRRVSLCHNAGTQCFFGAICGRGPIPTLIRDLEKTRVPGRRSGS